MKLLFDANLSPRLVNQLRTAYPRSIHVREAGLGSAPDGDIWDFARDGAFTIVSKDTDFRERSFVLGFPPKVVWLDVGNAGTQVIAALLRDQRERLERFGAAADESLLIVSHGPNAV